LIKTCLVCGGEYQSQQQAYGQKYCSLPCQRKATVDRMKEKGTYHEYKRSDYKKHKGAYKARAKRQIEQKRFSGLRDAVLERDGYKCTICGNTERLEVHHKDSSGRNKENPNNDIDNLQTLCSACHGTITNQNMGRWVNVDMDCVRREMETAKSIKEIAERLNVSGITLAYKMRKAGIDLKHKKTCEICGNEFEVDSQYHYKKYCSEQCHDKAGNIAEQKKKDEQREIVFRKCLYCSKEFEVNKFNPNQKFCNYAYCGRRYSYQQKHMT
jgi:5-methylcytosine-specific restriction endonuclease McrA